jgi:hypothetical protein
VASLLGGKPIHIQGPPVEGRGFKAKGVYAEETGGYGVTHGKGGVALV